MYLQICRRTGLSLDRPLMYDGELERKSCLTLRLSGTMYWHRSSKWQPEYLVLMCNASQCARGVAGRCGCQCNGLPILSHVSLFRSVIFYFLIYEFHTLPCTFQLDFVSLCGCLARLLLCVALDCLFLRRLACLAIAPTLLPLGLTNGGVAETPPFETRCST